MRAHEVIDSELRLLAYVRQVTLAESGTAPSISQIDQLLDERGAVGRHAVGLVAVAVAEFLHNVAYQGVDVD